MEGYKSIFASKTVWAALLAIASVAAGLAGYTFGAEEQEALSIALSSIGVAVFNVIAIFGRVKATKKIGSE